MQKCIHCMPRHMIYYDIQIICNNLFTSENLLFFLKQEVFLNFLQISLKLFQLQTQNYLSSRALISKMKKLFFSECPKLQLILVLARFGCARATRIFRNTILGPFWRLLRKKDGMLEGDINLKFLKSDFSTSENGALEKIIFHFLIWHQSNNGF